MSQWFYGSSFCIPQTPGWQPSFHYPNNHAPGSNPQLLRALRAWKAIHGRYTGPLQAAHAGGEHSTLPPMAEVGREHCLTRTVSLGNSCMAQTAQDSCAICFPGFGLRR